MKDHRNIIDQYFKSAKEEPVDISINDIQNLVEGLNLSVTANSSVLTQSIFKLKYILMLSTSAIVMVGALSFFTLKSEPLILEKTIVLEVKEVKHIAPEHSSPSETLVYPETQEIQKTYESQEIQIILESKENPTQLINKPTLPLEEDIIAKEKITHKITETEEMPEEFGNWPAIRIDAPPNSDDVVLEMLENETQQSSKVRLNNTRVIHALKDTSENKQTALSYDRIDYFGEIREYWALVKNDGKFGFIDTCGKEVVPTIYKRIEHFGMNKDQWAQVKYKGKFGFIDFDGKEVVAPKYDRIDFYGLNKENWAQVKSDKLFGFIDENGSEIVAPKYDRIDFFGQFHDNWALVKFKGKFGFIDSIGKEVVSLEYDRINHFGLYKKGWALVKKSGKYGFIDSEGNEIVPPVYDDISFFGLVKEGWMKVKRNGKELFIDEDGKEINNTSSTIE